VRSGIQQLPRIVVHDLVSNAQFDWGMPFPIFIERRDDYVPGSTGIAMNGAEVRGSTPISAAGKEAAVTDGRTVGIMVAEERSDGGGEQGEVVAKEELVGTVEKQPGISDTNIIPPDVSTTTDVEASTVRPAPTSTGIEAENIDLSETVTEVLAEDSETKTTTNNTVHSNNSTVEDKAGEQPQ